MTLNELTAGLVKNGIIVLWISDGNVWGDIGKIIIEDAQ